MDVVPALELHDGVATFAELTAAQVKPADLRRALETGVVERPHRGVYVLPKAWSAMAAAKRLGGVVSHTSAATFHGFELLHPDPTSHVTVPRARKKEKVVGVAVHRRDVSGSETLERWSVTSPERTVLDCLATLPLRDAVVLGDSALRLPRVDLEVIQAGAARLRGTGSRSAREAADLLDPKAESALESVGRVEIRMAGLPHPETQVVVETPTGTRRLDFLFRAWGVGVEADGFATHGQRAGLLDDCEKHNAYLLTGLLVLRFGFEHVMHMPAFFTDTIQLALDLAPVLRQVPQCPACGGLAARAAA